MALRRVLIFGAPGSGKGTISKFLVKDYGFEHVAAGDIIRNKLNSNDPSMVELRKLVSQGTLVPDATITEMIKGDLLAIENRNKKWLLDGYPRNITQAKLLQAFTSADLAINIDVPFAAIIERLCDRLIHESSGRIYNLKWNPPKKEVFFVFFKGLDDETGEPLTRRPDDNADTVSRRLNTYQELIVPVLQYYASQNILQTFKGDKSKVIYQSVKAYLDEKYPN